MSSKEKPVEKKAKPKAEEKKKAKPESKPVKAAVHAEEKAHSPEPKAEDVKVSVSDVKVSEASKEANAEAPEEEKKAEEQKPAGGFRAQKKVPEKAGKKEERKVLEERIYTIPLVSVMSATRKKRANKAVRQVRNYLSRHMHSTNVKIAAPLNEVIWSRGIQKPPRSVKVKALKYEDSVVAELAG